MAAILSPPFWISNFRPRNRNQRSQQPPYIHFCAIWTNKVEFSQKWPPYWIHHFVIFHANEKCAPERVNYWTIIFFYQFFSDFWVLLLCAINMFDILSIVDFFSILLHHEVLKFWLNQTFVCRCTCYTLLMIMKLNNKNVYFEFIIFNLGIVISDLKSPLYSFFCNFNDKQRI